VVDVVFQPGIEDELGEVEDEFERLGDDDRVLGFLMVVAMMLNPISAALYFFDYLSLLLRKVYPSVLKPRYRVAEVIEILRNFFVDVLVNRDGVGPVQLLLQEKLDRMKTG
jgi:hypothetical protein